MRPDEYEKIVADHFSDLGYQVELTSYSNDYGVDVFAIKDEIKIAIQVKMYGNTARKINRQMVMELHGAKDYFDCDKAIIATDGKILNNAMEVAKKLNIEVLTIPIKDQIDSVTNMSNKQLSFEKFWEEFIIPLQGKTLYRRDGKFNQITKVDWAGVERLTSNNRPQKIKIEIFKKTFLHLVEHGSITRDFINQEYPGRASSGIVLIMSNTPLFEKTAKPTGLKLIGHKKSGNR